MDICQGVKWKFQSALSSPKDWILCCVRTYIYPFYKWVVGCRLGRCQVTDSGVFATGSARATDELRCHQELLARAAKRRGKEEDQNEEIEQGQSVEEKMEQAPEPESPLVPPPTPEPRIRHKKFRKRQKLEEKEESSAEVISSSNLLPEKSVSIDDKTSVGVWVTVVNTSAHYMYHIRPIKRTGPN